MRRKLPLSIAALLLAAGVASPARAMSVQGHEQTFTDPIDFLAAVLFSQLEPVAAAPPPRGDYVSAGVPGFGDLTLMGPVGGHGGVPFQDVCDPAGIAVRSGWWIDAVRLVCRDGPYGPHRGGYGGGEHVFYLEPGERILGIRGSHHGNGGPYLYSLQIITDRRLSPVYGNGGPVGGHYPFHLEIPPGTELVGLHGRSGDFVDALGLVYLERSRRHVPPAPPRPLYPLHGTEVDNGCRDFREPLTQRFDWTEVTGAVRYHLYVRRVGSRNPAIDRADLFDPWFYEVSRAAYVAPHLLDGWEWRVRALVDGVWTEWSEPQRFRHEPLDADCPRYGASYEVGVSTGGELGAGTDAEVYIKLRGTLGESGWIPLRAFIPGNPFEAGDRDYATLHFPNDLGTVHSIALWNRGGDVLPDWCVAWVTVGIPGEVPKVFQVNRWLAPGMRTGWIG